MTSTTTSTQTTRSTGHQGAGRWPRELRRMLRTTLGILAALAGTLLLIGGFALVVLAWQTHPLLCVPALAACAAAAWALGALVLCSSGQARPGR